MNLQSDLSNTSRYIDPRNQQQVHSFEFAKILILSCTEFESVMKQICFELTHETHGSISEYKETILQHFPGIVDAKVYVPIIAETILPFNNWNNDRLFWWGAYTSVKHNRNQSIECASYHNALYALSALYLSVLYLSKVTNNSVDDFGTGYLYSPYSKKMYATFGEDLPTSCSDNSTTSISMVRRYNLVTFGDDKPPYDAQNKDIHFSVE